MMITHSDIQNSKIVRREKEKAKTKNEAKKNRYLVDQRIWITLIINFIYPLYWYKHEILSNHTQISRREKKNPIWTSLFSQLISYSAFFFSILFPIYFFNFLGWRFSPLFTFIIQAVLSISSLRVINIR